MDVDFSWCTFVSYTKNLYLQSHTMSYPFYSIILFVFILYVSSTMVTLLGNDAHLHILPIVKGLVVGRAIHAELQARSSTVLKRSVKAF